MPPGGWQQPAPQAPGWSGTPLASWGSRVGATLLDGLILLVPVAVLIVIVVGAFVGSDTSGIVAAILGFLTYLAVAFFYAPVLMARSGPRNGQTFGKQIVGIRVVRDNGAPVDFGFGLLREFVVKGLLFGLVGSFFLSIPTLVDWLWPLWDNENRTLHDMVVTTHVVGGG